MAEKKLSKKEQKIVEEHLQDTDSPSNTLRSAMSFVVGTGLPLPNLDGLKLEEVKFPNPAEMASMQDEVVTELMAEWTQLLNYANLELAKQDIEANAKANQYEKIRRKWRRTYAEGDPEEGIEPMTKEGARERAEDNEEVLSALYLSEVAKAKKELIEKLYKNYSQNYRLLSRELSRRGITTEGEWRSTKNQ